MDKSCKDHVSNLDVSRDFQGQKINLPQVEKPSEKISAPIQSITAMDKNKVTTDHSCYLRAHSNTLVLPFDSTKETKLENKSRLDLPSSKVVSEGLSAETHKVPECPNCKKERRIRNEYDKFILQSRKDKEALQKRIVELETELKRYEKHSKPTQGEENEVTCSMVSQRYLSFNMTSEQCASVSPYAAYQCAYVEGIVGKEGTLNKADTIQFQMESFIFSNHAWLPSTRIGSFFFCCQQT